MSALAIPTMLRNTSFFMTCLASLIWSVAVLTVVFCRPLGSVYVVFVMPRFLAAAFILVTKLLLSESQRASSRATLLPEGIISIWSI